MSYRCFILADSLNIESGDRLTTFEVCFPRMVLADITRHRSLSFSVESTRARPTETIIEQVRNDPYVPDFRARAKGMGSGEPLPPAELRRLQWRWIEAAKRSADTAESMLHAGKEHVGRLLESFAWVTAIISGTEWTNFFTLRAPPVGAEPDPRFPAQIELQRIAHLMRAARDSSFPVEMHMGGWHLPLVTAHERAALGGREAAHVSAGRCASVSFLKHNQGEGNLASSGRWEERLAPSKHWSPGEHPAQAVSRTYLGNTGNFRGWLQLRKFYPGEDGR